MKLDGLAQRALFVSALAAGSFTTRGAFAEPTVNEKAAPGVPVAPGVPSADSPSTAPPPKDEEKKPPDDDGWPDLSTFLDEKYGFLPIAMPITEPAIGYGVAGGLAFISQPFGAAAKGLGRPDVTFVGGFGTENGTWGVAAVDMRHWLDDHVQTIVGFVYASVNLDFHGFGEDGVLENNPIRYNLQPTGGLANVRYRFGDTLLWAGVGYMFAHTEVSADSPEDRPRLPNYEDASNVGGLTLAATFDSRDNFFTPTSGFYAEASVTPYAKWLGGDDNFERLALTAIEFLPLPVNLYVGAREDVAAAFGDAPFYLKPYVALRGVPIMRYQGDEIAQAEVELRWQFYGRLSLIGFAGAGVTWNDLGWGNDSANVFSGGGGFRYELARRYGLHMGVDVAASRDTTAFYIQVGSAWMRP
jgi:hypothetical protein